MFALLLLGLEVWGAAAIGVFIMLMIYGYTEQYCNLPRRQAEDDREGLDAATHDGVRAA